MTLIIEINPQELKETSFKCGCKKIDESHIELCSNHRDQVLNHVRENILSSNQGNKQKIES